MLEVTGAGSDQFGVHAAEPGGTVQAPSPTVDGALPDQGDDGPATAPGDRETA